MSFQFIGMERPASEVTHEERLAILSAVATAISELKTGKSSTDSQAFSHGATSISEGPETSEESETESSVALPAKVEPAATPNADKPKRGGNKIAQITAVAEKARAQVRWRGRAPLNQLSQRASIAKRVHDLKSAEFCERLLPILKDWNERILNHSASYEDILNDVANRDPALLDCMYSDKLTKIFRGHVHRKFFEGKIQFVQGQRTSFSKNPFKVVVKELL